MLQVLTGGQPHPGHPEPGVAALRGRGRVRVRVDAPLRGDLDRHHRPGLVSRRDHGIQFQLGQIQSTQMTMELDNFDGALTRRAGRAVVVHRLGHPVGA